MVQIPKGYFFKGLVNLIHIHHFFYHLISPLYGRLFNMQGNSTIDSIKAWYLSLNLFIDRLPGHF